MYPNHDMNPIAIEHMWRERLEANVRFVDRINQAGPSHMARLLSTLRGRRIRRGIGAPDELRDPSAEPQPDQ
jgi:hypothetical protein